MNGYTGNFELVDPRNVLFDHRYQRPLKESLVSQIASAPSWEAFGVPVCFKHGNGLLYCADGQQRITGLLRSPEPPRLIPIVWFELEDLRDEAEVFVFINEWRKGLLPLEKHKAQIKAGNEAALGIERAAEMAGFSIGHARGHRGGEVKTIQAVGTLGRIYNAIGEEGLLQTLTQVRDAWPDDGIALSTNILMGVADLIEEQGDDYTRSKLTTALRKTQPNKVERLADQLKHDLGDSKRANIRRAFETLCGLKRPQIKARKAKEAAIRKAAA